MIKKMDPASNVSLLNVKITTRFNSFFTERRFAEDISIGKLKLLLEGLTGASPLSMQLELFNKDGSLVGPLSDENASLASCGIQNGMTIQVSDPSIAVGEFEDVSKVKKFELSEEEYTKRSESLRAFKQQHKIGQFGQGNTATDSAKRDAESEKLMASMEIGNRCLVQVLGQPAKKGTIKYKGSVHFKPGNWVGVQYDEPLGKHDGTVDGKQYFNCPLNYGAIVKAENVHVGDYPEDDFMSEM